MLNWKLSYTGKEWYTGINNNPYVVHGYYVFHEDSVNTAFGTYGKFPVLYMDFGAELWELLDEMDTMEEAKQYAELHHLLGASNA